MELIWKKQLKNIAKGVILTYIGTTDTVKRIGLCDEHPSLPEFWMKSANSIHKMDAADITDRVSTPYLRKRIKQLVTRGLLIEPVKQCNFMIDIPSARKAFTDALTFWRSYGLSDDRTGIVDLPISTFNKLADDLTKLLYTKHESNGITELHSTFWFVVTPNQWFVV